MPIILVFLPQTVHREQINPRSSEIPDDPFAPDYPGHPRRRESHSPEIIPADVVET